MNTTATRTASTRRLAVRGGVVLGSIALAASLSACGDKGTQVYERSSNGTTHGVTVLQPGTYKLDLSCTDRRSSSTSRTRKGKKTTHRTGSSPKVYFSTSVDGRPVTTNAFCSGSDTEKFTIAAPTPVTLDATVTGDATYRAKVYLLK